MYKNICSTTDFRNIIKYSNYESMTQLKPPYKPTR